MNSSKCSRSDETLKVREVDYLYQCSYLMIVIIDGPGDKVAGHGSKEAVVAATPPPVPAKSPSSSPDQIKR